MLDKCTILFLCILELRIRSVGASQITEPDFQLSSSLTYMVHCTTTGRDTCDYSEITLRLLSVCDFPRSLFSFRLLPQKGCISANTRFALSVFRPALRLITVRRPYGTWLSPDPAGNQITPWPKQLANSMRTGKISDSVPSSLGVDP